jgi:Transposase DDE domain group 1
MRLLHTAAKTHATFDDPNLVSHAGLVPAVRLVQNVGLDDLVAEHVRVAAKVGANPDLKIGSLVAGMVAGADTIDGMDLLRHGAVPATVGGIRAPSTLGSFLRAFDHGNVRQLAAVHRRVLTELAARTPLLPGADAVAFVDVDSVQRRVYGGTKQGAAFGHAKIASKSLWVRGLNVLAATVSTPLAAPVVTATRLRGGNAGSARGAATLVAEAINTARQAGATGLIVVRADSAYYAGAFVAACRRNQARFSVTVRMDPKVRRAIATISDDAWTAIKYPNAIYDEQAGEWISDAEIAEVPYTAFASSRAHRTDGRLIVRRVRRLNPKSAAQGQGELFSTYRYHAVFTDSPFPLAQAESDHRAHAVVEQVFADLIDGPWAHLPSAAFNANAAWVQLAVTAHALTRALGALASARHAVARGATIRAELIQFAGRPARSGRDTITWHLPEAWPWQDAWLSAFDATHRPPPALTA